MKIRVPFCIIIILLSVLSYQTHPQSNIINDKNSAPDLANINFTQLNREHGLSDAYVQSIIQDSKGFIWIGTLNGLQRYDGIKLKVFRHSPDDPNSLGSNGAMSLYEDKSGTLWVGTNGGGINKYNPEQENFTRYINKDDSSSLANYFSSIFEDSYGDLWAGSFYEGLCKFNRDTGTFTSYKNIPGDSNSLSDNRVWPIHEDALGNLWIGTFHGGLNRFDRKENKFTRYIYDPQNPTSINNNVITWICGDTSGGIWVATVGGGINKIKYNDSNEPVFSYINQNPDNPFSLNDSCITTIIIDNNNTMWAGTTNSGLNRTLSDIYESDSLLFFSYSHDPLYKSGLTNNTVACLYKDNMGLIWVGTWGAGVCVYNTGQKQFRHFYHMPGDPASLSSNDVSSIYEDNSGNIWVGTRDAGLNKWDRKTKKFLRYRHNSDPNSISYDRVTAIYSDNSNFLWIGAYNKGLNRFDMKTEKFKVYQHDPLNNKSINYDAISCIIEDKTGMLWIGNEYDGLTMFNKKTGNFQQFRYNPQDSGSLSSNGISILFIDRSGNLWIGTTAGGINIFDYQTRKFIKYKHYPGNPNSLSNNNISVIFEDNSGTFWIGTFEEGLNRFEKNKGLFRRFGMEDGLPSNSINEILEDDHGNLWISTDNGISKFNPVTESFRNYDIHDGLPDIGMKGGVKSRTGEMIFFSSNGLIIFHPDSIKDNTHVPPVYITGFSLFNRPVPIGYDSLSMRAVLKKSIIVSDIIELNYDDKVFTIEFAALDFQAPQKNKYAYILEGFDNDWTFTDANRNSATYTNLDPGKYIFRVKGSNNDGVWNEAGISIDIIILPPWWQTYWAYIFYILFIGSIIYFTWKAKLRRLSIKNDYEMSRFEAQKLHELDEMKSRFFTNISHEFRTPLTLIIGPVKQLLEKINDENVKSELQHIHRNAGKLLKLVNQLLNISKLESGNVRLQTAPQNIVPLVKALVLSFTSYAERKSICLKFNSTADEIIVFLDKDILEKIIINILSNAFKFTPDYGTIGITINTEDGYLKIRICDTGVGIPEDKLPRIFDRFYQVDGSHTREQEGTGIGLALTKELVELHKGRIEADSREGKGTTFTVTIPLGKEHLKPEEICHSESESCFEEDYFSREFSGNTFNIEDKLDTDLIEKDKFPLLLLVEDNSEVRKYLKDNLKSEYRIVAAVNGEEGWHKAVDLSFGGPDLIISDVMMPKMDGFELCEKLKSDERTSHIPIILLTAKAATEDKIEGYKTGADEYILKPFEPDILKARIRNLLEQRKRIHEHFKKSGITGLEDIKITPEDKSFLKKVFELINLHISDSSFGVDSLSASLNISRSVLHRKTTSLTGEPPGELIRRLRLKKASKLIEQGFGNIAEIALEVGFSNPAHFTNSFHKEFGLSPSAFLQKIKNNS